MDVATVRWNERASREAKKNPRHRVGTVVSDTLINIPCTHNGTNLNLSARDVLAVGNCIYHAVWQSSDMQGIPTPFGLRGVAHVYTLRVLIARKVAQMIVNGDFGRSIGDWGTVSSFVAEPNQYLKFSGMVPLMAMASILRRSIVTLSADGIATVTPANFEQFFGEEETQPPIAIYHCCAGCPGTPVSHQHRNHYVAVNCDPGTTLVLQNMVAEYRDSHGAIIDVAMDTVDSDVMDDVRVPSTSTTETITPMTTKPQPTVVDTETGPRRRIRERKNVFCTSDDGREYFSTKKKTRVGECDVDILKRLDETATTLVDISGGELQVLATSQNYTCSPRLGLLYYHCSSNDPRAYVFNDESLINTNTTTTKERLYGCLNEKLDEDTIQSIQTTVEQKSGVKSSIFACASCCEILQVGDPKPSIVSFANLPDSFRVLPHEAEIDASLPDWVRENHMQVLMHNNVLFHLNPDLIHDLDAIPLCSACYPDPRKSKYSIAAGHDYGRRGSLSPLSELAISCICPVRVFGVEISVLGRHSTGHTICFPSDGPVKCVQVLPRTDFEQVPRVTFVGPREAWWIRKSEYERLYEMPIDSIYDWINVLQHLHTGFRDRGVTIEDSQERREALQGLHEFVDKGVVFEDSDEGHNSRHDESEYPLQEDGILLSASAVLKPISREMSHENSTALIDTLLDVVGDGTTNTRPVVAIQRENDPFVEWENNGEIIACAFPQLFLRGGKFLPKGSWPQGLINHLMRYYDGRFEENIKLVALLFNQLQRHAAIKRAAKVAVTNSKVLERFGNLVNSTEFRQQLQTALNNPQAKSTRRLTASLLRVLSLVGGCVPFSPFERAAARPKISALRYRYGVPMHWVTISPPEHDDVVLHRIAMIRKLQCWNDMNNVYVKAGCTFDDLPEDLKCSARCRLAVANRYPALSVGVFEQRMQMIFNDIMLNRQSSTTRISRNYTERIIGSHGRVAAHFAVVEPQVNGRLHTHALIYGSSYTPELLTRISCCPELRARAAVWLDSVSTTKLGAETHDWLAELRNDRINLPRMHQIHLPPAAQDLDAFYHAAEKRIATTNTHSHSSTCFKTARGKYMCRLARPAGVHIDATRPLLLIRDKLGDLSKGKRPSVTAIALDRNVADVIDLGYDPAKGELFRKALPGPIVWELNRPERDQYLVETNRVLGAMIESHTNSAITSGEDAGDAVEQYQQAYMTKDDQALKGAIPVLIAAIDHVNAFPSVADDRDTALRKGKYLASRTVNAFSGAHEWAHSVMVYAICGHRSLSSSDTFWYIYPHQFMTELNRMQNNHVPSEPKEFEMGDGDCSSEVDKSNGELEELVAMANNDYYAADSSSVTGRGGGTRAYKVDNKVVFVSQTDSYIHRGEHFLDFSPLEFECIVDVLVRDEVPQSSLGRHRRKGFPFAPTHPLFNHYEGFIRAKMHTPVFGGAPPPVWKEKNKRSRRLTAQFILANFTAWCHQMMQFSNDENGLFELCKSWDNSKAPLIHRQRYRYIRNLLRRGHRSSTNEQILTDWRNRNVDLWKDLKTTAPRASNEFARRVVDNEQSGILDDGIDLYALTQSISSSKGKNRNCLRTLQMLLTSVMDTTNADRDMSSIMTRNRSTGVYTSSGDFLHDLEVRIKSLKPTPDTSSIEPTQGIEGLGNVFDPLSAVNNPHPAPSTFSKQQLVVWNHIFSMVDDKHPLGPQSLTIMHGGGGTGKSYAVRKITAEVKRMGFDVVNTSPTGAGACQLTFGQTVHSAFKSWIKGELSVHVMELMKQIFTSKVALIVIDEVSMLSAELFATLDERLRALYDANKVFGGISILLVGDFLQLRVVKGTSLCSLLYTKISKPNLLTARDLFKKFRVIFLYEQRRAQESTEQQSLLDAYRALPSTYPNHNQWSKFAGSFTPMNSDMICQLTRELTADDCLSDPLWLEKSVILVTGNTERAALNASMARIVSRHNQIVLYRWRKPLLKFDDKMKAIEELLYDEDERPTLFGYFFKSARGQILDNGNGNVGMGVANGSSCIYHSMAWSDPDKTTIAMRLTEKAVASGELTVELPFPPEYINVMLVDRDQSPISASYWPKDANLAGDEDGDEVIIPIGTVRSSDKKFFIKMPTPLGNIEINYEQHAVDLAMALTVWKAQGSTFDRVILLLDRLQGSPSWGYEHLYVAMSRIRAATHIRCLPLSMGYSRKKLHSLKPNIFTIRWRMDINSNGYWESNENTAAIDL